MKASFLSRLGLLLGALVGCHTTHDFVGSIEQGSGSAGMLSTQDGDDEEALLPQINLILPPPESANKDNEKDGRDEGNGDESPAGGRGQEEDEDGDRDTQSGAPSRTRPRPESCNPEQSLQELGFQLAWLNVGETCQVRVSINWSAQDFWSGRAITTEQRFFYEALLAGRPPSSPPSDGLCPEDQAMSWWREYRLFVGETYHLCPGLCAKAAELIPEVIAFGCGEAVSPELTRILSGGTLPKRTP